MVKPMAMSRARPAARPSTRRETGRGGFTLIEVLIAVAVLSIAMVAVIKAGLLSQDGLIRSNDAQEGMALALAKLDEVEAAGPNAWSLLNGDFEDAEGWRWELEISSTSLEVLYLVRIKVGRGKDDPRPARLERLLWRR